MTTKTAKTLKSESFSAESLKSYLENKATKHESYKYYSNIHKIESIVHNRALILSNGARWNDRTDRENFNSENSSFVNFGSCFSFSKSENVALWMLYGGLEKKGAMLNLTPHILKESIDDLEYIEFGGEREGEFITYLTLPIDQCEVKLIDILYYEDQHDGECKIKRSNESCNVPLSNLSQIKYSKKHLPWSYENECRLIVSVKKELINDDRIWAVKIPFSNSISSKKLMKRIVLAPNFAGEKEYKISSLSTELDWDMCDNCNIKCVHACSNRLGIDTVSFV